MEERTTDIQGQERQETQPARAGEWKVDVAEIMDGIHDEEAGAPDTAVTTQPVDGEDGEGIRSSTWTRCARFRGTRS